MSAQDIPQIIWPEPAPVRDARHWAHGKTVVHGLCAMGTVKEWLRGRPGKDTYMSMPYIYDVDGVEVEFLPCWGFYKVEGISLAVPQNETQIHRGGCRENPPPARLQEEGGVAQQCPHGSPAIMRAIFF